MGRHAGACSTPPPSSSATPSAALGRNRPAPSGPETLPSAFESPTRPEFHRVELIDLTPDIGKDVETPRAYLTVAVFYTHDSSVSLPVDQLRSGHTYYVRVAAGKEGWKFGERAPRSSTYRTSIYSAPFVFGTAPAPAEP